jgi:hypothetical protein
VPPEGRHIDRPEGDQVYTITASYRGVTVTRSIPVKVVEAEGPRPGGLTLTVSSPPPSDDGQIEVEVGDRVVLRFGAKDAPKLRIDGVTPLQLEGSSGQRTVELKGEGRYMFTLVATDDKNHEVRSESIEVVARCPSFLKRPWPFRCNRELEVEWK